MSNTNIPVVNVHKHLGVYVSDDGTWNYHLSNVKERAWTRINNMRRLRYILDRKSLEILYLSFIRPVIEYADVVWDNCSLVEKQDLERIQYEAARIVTGCSKLVSLHDLLKEVGWEKLSERRRKHKLILFYKMVNGITPNYLSSMVPRSIGQSTNYYLRNENTLRLELICMPGLSCSPQ